MKLMTDAPPLLKVSHALHWPAELVSTVRCGWGKKFRIYRSRRVDGQSKFDIFQIWISTFGNLVGCEDLDGEEMVPAADMLERSFRDGLPDICLRGRNNTAGSHWRGLSIPKWAAPLVAEIRRVVDAPPRAEEAATQTPEYARGFADGVKHARSEGKPF